VALRGTSARRYAEAVFELAAEQDRLDQWSNDLQTIAGFTTEADVARLLTSNRVPNSEKERLLSAGIEKSLFSPQAWNLVRLLLSRNKLHLAPAIAQAYQEMADDRRGVAHATVTTAVPLSDGERQAVEQRLQSITGKRIDVTTVVDPAIIGGIVARVGDQLIDGSTRTRLVALKRRLAAAAG
jgi:F-type H+-transporting ATPase subunit delta